MSDPLMCSCGRQRVESGNDLCARCRADWERRQQERQEMERQREEQERETHR